MGTKIHDDCIQPVNFTIDSNKHLKKGFALFLGSTVLQTMNIELEDAYESCFWHPIVFKLVIEQIMIKKRRNVFGLFIMKYSESYIHNGYFLSVTTV